MQYAMLAVAALLLAVTFVANKGYQLLCGDSPQKVLGFNCLLGLFTFAVFVFINRFEFSFTLFSLFLSVIMNALVVGYSFISFKLLKSGTMALYTIFLMSGGMILPYIFGIVFLNEPFGILRLAALIFIFLGVIVSNSSKQKTSKKQLLMCIAVFVLNGFVSIISKIHQAEAAFPTVTASEFVMIGGIVRFVLCGTLFIVMKEKKQTHPQKKKNLISKLICLIALAAISDGVSYLLQLRGASNLPATVIYPFITGGSIVFSTLAGALVFGEKLTARTAISVALCFCGTLMFL